MWFHDERAILASLIGEAVVHVALSNVLVRREPVPYVDAAMRKAVFKWGIPLMLNGVGLMAVKQLDQVIVANLFDLKTLALYALSINLAITPATPIQAIGQKLCLPFLGNAKSNPQLARQASLLTLLITACVAAAYALPVGLLLDQLVPLLYGHQYHITETFCALAMVDAFLRFCRGGPNMILLHHGLTSRLTVGNLTAGIGTALALALGLWTGRLEAVMVGLVVGDFISLIFLLALLRRHLAVATVMFHNGLILVTLCAAAAAIWTGGNFSIGERVLVFVLGGGVIGLDAVVVFQQYGRDLLRRPGQLAVRHAVPDPAVGTVAVQGEPSV
jgi:O-antigen/teichoic acid export membrane protein